MLSTRILCAWLLLGLAHSAKASAALINIDFGTGGFLNLPYTEDAFTFSLITGSGFISGTPNRNLSVNLPAAESISQVRISSATPFDFLSFDIEATVARDWMVVASSGTTLSLPHLTAAGTTNLPNISGWKNLTYVDVIHNANQDNAIIKLDNFMFESPSTAVPEPSSLMLMTLALITSFGIAFPHLRRRVRCIPCSE